MRSAFSPAKIAFVSSSKSSSSLRTTNDVSAAGVGVGWEVLVGGNSDRNSRSVGQHRILNVQLILHAECEDDKDHPEVQPRIGDRLKEETHERYAATFTHPASKFWRRISTPRQEHQVGRFLGLSEERLSRRA